MSIVLDSTVFVDILRGSRPALSFFDDLQQYPVSSEVTRVEIMRGLRSGERDRAELAFQGVEWVWVTETIARRAGQLGREYRRSHANIGVPDLIVAATAQELGADLATSNVRHFPMFKGLRPPYRD